jgi:FkbM family methyltransferase
MSREVGPEPELLWRAGAAASDLGAAAVHDDDVPGAEVVAVVAGINAVRSGLKGGCLYGLLPAMNLRPGRRLRVLLSRSETAYRLGRRGQALARFVARRPHERDFAAFRHFAAREGLFLDVGANIGQSALSFRIFQKRAPILSIEANPYNEPDLRFVSRLVKRFDFLICAAGDSEGVATLYTPTFRGVPITGEATFDRESAYGSDRIARHVGAADPDDSDVIEQQVAVRRLDDLALKPAFVKIDVEGAEPGVLRGLRQTLHDHHPVLMIERNATLREVKGLLSELGYETFVYDPESDAFDRFGDQAAQNLFYLAGADTNAVPLRQ